MSVLRNLPQQILLLDDAVPKARGPDLREYRRGPRISPHGIAPQLEALVLRLQEERQYGIKRVSMFLARYHQVYVSPPTMYRVLKEPTRAAGLAQAISPRPAAAP